MQYKESGKTYRYQSDFDIYSVRNEKISLEVGFNNVTGKMYRMFYQDFSPESNLSKEEKNQDECRRIATEYLGQFTDSISDYELIRENYTPSSDSFDVASFTFVRKIDGIETTDQATIHVDKYGTVFSYLLKSFGELKNCKAPSKSEMETIEQAVAAKLDQIYTLSDEFSYRHDTQTVTLVRLEDGKRALIYDINVTKQSGDGETTYYSELCKLVVPLD